jgi:hypothetical protein
MASAAPQAIDPVMDSLANASEEHVDVIITALDAALLMSRSARRNDCGESGQRARLRYHGVEDSGRWEWLEDQFENEINTINEYLHHHHQVRLHFLPSILSHLMKRHWAPNQNS